MTIDVRGPTYPEAGGMATNPATAPDAAPSTVGLPRMAHSLNIHDNAAEAAAVFVTVKALVASAPADSALPALNPNQPNHRRAAPVTVKGRLCGGMGSCPKPRRRPMTNAAASAEIPE